MRSRNGMVDIHRGIKQSVWYLQKVWINAHISYYKVRFYIMIYLWTKRLLPLRMASYARSWSWTSSQSAASALCRVNRSTSCSSMISFGSAQFPKATGACVGSICGGGCSLVCGLAIFVDRVIQMWFRYFVIYFNGRLKFAGFLRVQFIMSLYIQNVKQVFLIYLHVQNQNLQANELLKIILPYSLVIITSSAFSPPCIVRLLW